MRRGGTRSSRWRGSVRGNSSTNPNISTPSPPSKSPTPPPPLLPGWRGAAPVERAILAGDAETGVTIHRTVKELDAGPIAAQRSFPIGPEDDAGTVFTTAAELAAELVDE